MPVRKALVMMPEMALTMVRRVTAKLPHNHFLFRVAPKWTKNEITEYLEKVYNVKVARVATSILLGMMPERPLSTTIAHLRPTRELPLNL